MSIVYPDNLYNEYSSFYNNLTHLFQNNDFLESIKDEDQTQYVIRVNNLIKTLKNQVNFNNFAKSKIKVFSHKESDTLHISESLFGKNLSLKKIFNNQNEMIKDLLWSQLHRMVLYELEQQNKPLKDKNIYERIEKLKPIQKKLSSDPRDAFKSILKTDNLNDSTNNLINDIFSSFENSGSGKNPLDNLLNISSVIGEKYKDKIDNGEIDLNSLLGGLQNNLPGMEGMKKMMEPLMNMVQSKPEEPKETVIIDENFSTADIEIGKQEESSQPMFGNMLKSLDSTGILNMIKGGIGGGAGGLGGLGTDGANEGIGKLLNTLTNLNLDDPNLEDTLKNDLGIDMTQISEQMSKILQQQSQNK
jgi:hypothetical protein